MLTEIEIIDQEINFLKWDDLPIFFSSTNKHTLPFDFFSASFYLVSRYEEYLPHFKDHYDRFMAKESLAYQNDFLHLPLINLWADKLKEQIIKKYPHLIFLKKSLNFFLP